MNQVALAARARGLGARLMSPDVLASVDRAVDLGALAAKLVVAGYGTVDKAAGVESIDRAVGRRVGDDLVLLHRWCQGRVGVVAVLVDEVDAGNLRTLVRGLAGHVAVSRRLAGTVPTPALPENALEALAASTTLGELAERLAHRGHPYTAAIARAATDTPVDLLAIEAAVMRCFAERARARGGDLAARTFVGQILDVHNASAALQLAERGAELAAGDYLLAGGQRLEAAMIAAGEPAAQARNRLERAFARTPLAGALVVGAPHVVEDAALQWRLATQTAMRRREPLGSATVLWLGLARRLELRQIRRAAWRIALGGHA